MQNPCTVRFIQSWFTFKVSKDKCRVAQLLGKKKKVRKIKSLSLPKLQSQLNPLMSRFRPFGREERVGDGRANLSSPGGVAVRFGRESATRWAALDLYCHCIGSTTPPLDHADQVFVSHMLHEIWPVHLIHHSENTLFVVCAQAYWSRVWVFLFIYFFNRGVHGGRWWSPIAAQVVPVVWGGVALRCNKLRVHGSWCPECHSGGSGPVSTNRTRLLVATSSPVNTHRSWSNWIRPTKHLLFHENQCWQNANSEWGNPIGGLVEN